MNQSQLYKPARPRLTAALLLVFGNSAFASNTIEEIVVTAQKRAQTIEEVPISMTVVSGEALENNGLVSVNDLPMMVPGLRIDYAGGFSQPSIRGVGSSLAGAGFTSNIATYVDGFYVPSQLSTNLALMSLDNVQVLKGPQGTLFGRNATGGAILLTSQTPSIEPTARVRIAAGEYAERNLGFYASTGISDNTAIDVAGFWKTGDGFVDNIVTGADDDGEYDNKAYRISLATTLNENIDLRLTYSGSDQEDPYAVVTGSYAGLSAGTPFGAVVASDFHQVSNTSKTDFTSDFDAWFLTATIDLGFAELKSLTMTREDNSFSVLDLDGSSFPVFDVTFDIANDTVSQEFNLSGTTDSGLEWIAGAYYLELEEYFNPFTASAGGTPHVVLYDLGNEITSWAAFADITWPFAEQWYLTLGVRYSAEEADAFFNVQPAAIAFGVAPSAGLTEFSGDWSKTTPRAILRYEIDDDANIYLSYSQGFKAGVLAPSSFSTTPVEQEGIDAIELGYKRATANSRLELAVFSYDYKDLQVASYDGVSAIVTNAANSSIWGLEAQYSASFTEHWDISLGLAYTDGEYDDYPGAPIFHQDLSLPPGPTFGLFPAATNDSSGFDIQRTPELTGNLTISYSTNLAGGLLNINSNYYYSSDFYFDPSQQFEQDAYGVMNLSGNWTTPNGHWSFGIFVNNLFDEQYLAQVLPGNFAVQQTFGAPRVAGITAEFNY